MALASLESSLVKREGVIPAKTARKSRTIPRSPEATRVGRELAVLALAWVKQEGHLKVRQREQLRRAITAGAEFLGWATLNDDPLEVATKDLVKLTKNGAQTIAGELSEAVAGKKAEVSELKKFATSMEKLAAEGDFTDPIEVNYYHTARRSPEDLVTKTETLTLTEAQEATDAARTVEKKLESWGKLADQMLAELKQQQKQLEEMKRNLVDFVESSAGLVREVFAILH